MLYNLILFNRNHKYPRSQIKPSQIYSGISRYRISIVHVQSLLLCEHGINSKRKTVEEAVQIMYQL